jgi:putative endonuclease
MFWNQFLGRKGESRACWYLRLRGYKIIARRYRTRFGEIDLVVRRRRILYFVEVKTRSQPGFGDPLESITPYKLKHLKRAALSFLQKNPKYREGYAVSFMAVAVRNYPHEKPVECVSFLLD